MSSKMKPIRDPEDPKAKPIEMIPKMNLIDIQPCEGKVGSEPLSVKSLQNRVPDDKVKGMQRIGGKDSPIDTIKLSEQVLESIDSIGDHNGFTIGKGQNKMYCGPVIQRIPKGGYARIGGGQSVFWPKPPITKEPKMVFKFDKTRQLAIKVGNNVGKDWVAVVANNGCIFLDTASYASFTLPLFIVEQSGEYYKVEQANRILLLGTGNHLMFYTKEAPILYIRRHTITHQKSIPTPIQSSAGNLKSNSLEANEPLEQMAAENQNVLKTASNETKKKEESNKTPKPTHPGPTLGHNTVITKKQSLRSLQVPVSPPRESGTTLPAEGQPYWKVCAGIIGLILLLLLLLYIVYRLFFSKSPILRRRKNLWQ